MDVTETTSNLAYETQHFGFHPRIFLDKIYNGFYESIFEALTQLKKHLIEEYSNTVSANGIELNTEALFKQLIQKLDFSIDRLEVYLDTNIFKIPKHIVLPEDEVHVTHPCTAKEDEKLDKELEHLKQKILEERTRRYFLKSKIAEQKSIIEDLVLFENKLQQILTVVVQSRLTKEDLKATLEKCYNLSIKLKEPMKVDK